MARPYEEKAAEQHSIVMSSDGLRRLETLQTKLGVSRADIVGRLLKYSISTTRLGTRKIWFPKKQFPPLSIKLTPSESEALRALKDETKHSWGECIEALLVQHGDRLRVKAS